MILSGLGVVGQLQLHFRAHCWLQSGKMLLSYYPYLHLLAWVARDFVHCKARVLSDASPLLLRTAV